MTLFRMAEKRVKVRVEHCRKMFYQRFLECCREMTEYKNQKYVFYKALHGLKQFPLEVEGIVELKQIHGIGDMLAVRCEAAWDSICSERQSILTLNDVKQLNEDDYKSLWSATKDAKKKRQDARKLVSGSHAKPKSGSRKDEFEERPAKVARFSRTVSAPCRPPPNPAPSFPRSKSGPNEFVESDDDIAVVEVVRPSNATSQVKLSGSSMAPSTSDQASGYQKVVQSDEKSSQSSQQSSPEISYLMCQPYQQPEVILICDNREYHGSKKGKTVVEHLTSASIRFELRSLSVGDYLWVARLIDGSELVLDWVVERKTWEDLRQSIKKGRYEEQKQRLRNAPMQHRVYLIEGTGRGDVAAEQALSTTLARDNFLIQRCDNGRETARFLQSVTEKLMKRANVQQLNGIRFEDLQELSKKVRAETVHDTWVRQLTVCPGMSTSRAQAVAASFPSMSALADYYAKPGSSITQAIPQLPRAVGSQLSKFFE